jgi:hypothetical protein
MNKNNNQECIQITLNSKSALSYIDDYTSNCIFTLPHIIIPTKNLFLSVDSVQIPISYYNVDYYNNTLVYSVNSGPILTVTIPDGNYNVNTLRSYLQSVMTGFTITYESLTNKYIFTNTNNFIFYSTSLCFEVIGFTEDINHSSTSNILKSDNVINFYTIRNILVQSDNVITNNINNYIPNVASIIATIPVGGVNSILSYSNFSNIKNSISSIHNFSRLHIKLTDQDGDILDLNGCHWSILLTIWY